MKNEESYIFHIRQYINLTQKIKELENKNSLENFKVNETARFNLKQTTTISLILEKMT